MYKLLSSIHKGSEMKPQPWILSALTPALFISAAMHSLSMYVYYMNSNELELVTRRLQPSDRTMNRQQSTAGTWRSICRVCIWRRCFRTTWAAVANSNTQLEMFGSSWMWTRQTQTTAPTTLKTSQRRPRLAWSHVKRHGCGLRQIPELRFSFTHTVSTHLWDTSAEPQDAV